MLTAGYKGLLKIVKIKSMLLLLYCKQKEFRFVSGLFRVYITRGSTSLESPVLASSAIRYTTMESSQVPGVNICITIPFAKKI